ncbi:MAG: hypothetical protein EAZ99_06855 [Alphaproteobacteria bacterium]|nr:MAG: hypothetical protein EAZ99_06855 [Alphaproteobacteria bacterium]
MRLWRRSGPTPGSAPLWIALALEIGAADRWFAVADGMPRLLAALRRLGVPLTVRLDAGAATAPWSATVRAAGHEVAVVPDASWFSGDPLLPTLDAVSAVLGHRPVGWGAPLPTDRDVAAARAAGLHYDTAGEERDTPQQRLVAGSPWVTLATTARWPADGHARLLRLIDHLEATATPDHPRHLVLALDAGPGGRVLAEPDLAHLMDRLDRLEQAWFTRQDHLAKALSGWITVPSMAGSHLANLETE